MSDRPSISIGDGVVVGACDGGDSDNNIHLFLDCVCIHKKLSNQFVVLYVKLLDTICKVVSDVNLTRNIYVAGKGSFVVLPNVTIDCSRFAGCEFGVNVTGNLV